MHRPVVSDLPDDFGERIEEFRVAGGLTLRSLARLLGVSPYRLREWRRGVAPDSRHLYLLLMIAGRMALRSCWCASATTSRPRSSDNCPPPAKATAADPAALARRRADCARRATLCTRSESPCEAVTELQLPALIPLTPWPRQPLRLTPDHKPTLTSRAGIAMSSTTRRNGTSAA